MTAANERKRGIEDSPFSYRETGQDRVLIFWRGKQVTILKGSKARSFLVPISEADGLGKQMVMAKITGNFKRGNE